MNVKKQANIENAGMPTEQQLAKINEQAKTPLCADDVYVFSVRLCDDQPDRDFERFSAAALPKLAELFRGKTGIIDHDWSSEKQTARIFDTGVECAEGESFIRAWAYILRSEKNAEVIREIEAGIKKEVSVGCAMAKRICSVCGAEYGECGHEKGQQYGNQTCIAVLCEPVDAYEFSFVAVPAQKNAGVMKAFSEQEEKKTAALAELGRAYQKNLQKSFVRLALLLELGLDEKTLSRMASALSPLELKNAEDRLKEKCAQTYPLTFQLTNKKELAQDENGAFLI